MRSRILLVIGLTAAFVAAPVVTPAWAAPQPVSPHVTRVPLSGVDSAALGASPSAYDPSTLAKATVDPTPSTARAARSLAPVVFTAAMTTGSFTAAGVSWSPTSAPSQIVVQVRIRERGAWSDWQPLDLADQPDPGSPDAVHAANARATEPITSASADGIQVRLDARDAKRPSELMLVLVDAGKSAADANLTGSPAATAHGAVTSPPIITRAQWGADESMRTCSPTYSSTIKAGFIHHTVNSNNYSPADVAGLIRAIYAYHVYGNGWCDVGYQFLVDKYGRIFEGRAGGIDRPVIGAQAGGFNLYTFGVSGIGNFTSEPPTAAMLTAFSQLLGWKFGLHGVNPLGRTSLVSAGGPYTPYPSGTIVPLRVTSGHRDVDATGCPGDDLYPLVDSLASRAATYIATNEVRGTVPSTLNGGSLPLLSPNGQFRLNMQIDGNLVVYNAANAPTWNSATNVPYSYLRVQADGNVVIYDSEDGFPLWSASVYSPGARLQLQNDGNLVLYSTSGVALWDAAGYTRHAPLRFVVKRAFSDLASGESVRSHDNAYVLRMQADGNLVEYSASGHVLWATNTNIPGSRLTAQADGNVVMYTPDGRPVWNTFLYSPGAYVVIQNDGNIVEYSAAGRALWDAQGNTGHRAVRLL